jgi:hypothetical protein
LQEHFQEKIRLLLVGPIEDMQKMENLKGDYLSSSSSAEKKQIKRELSRLEKTMEDYSPFIYSDSIVYNDLPPLTEEEVQLRLAAVGELNPILQGLYKKRCGVNETGDLRLAIELEHFEPQIQLLEQARYAQPVTYDLRHEIRIAFLNLPNSVRGHFANKLGMENGEDTGAVIDALTKREKEEWMTLQQAVQNVGYDGDTGGLVTNAADLPEYADIEFVDRSRYIQELISPLTKLEIIYPPTEDVDALLKEVLDRRLYKTTSKPERVVGGYFIYGENQLADSKSANTDELVSKLQERLNKSSVGDRIDLFYIQDPTPPTDEECEMGEFDRPVLFVTAKNRALLYSPSTLLTKTLVSSLGLISVLLFSLATAEMQPVLRDRLEAAAAGDLSMDVSTILNGATLVGTGILATAIAHEAGHRLIAWKEKVNPKHFSAFFPSLPVT